MLRGKPLTDYIAEAMRPQFQKLLTQALNTEAAPLTWETQILPQGEHVPLTVMIQGILVANCDDYRPAGVCLRWTLLDVTEQRLAETAEREREFQATFEQAAVGMAHIDTEGRWLRVNQKLCAILRYTEPELIGQAFHDAATFIDVSQIRHKMQKLLQGEIPNFAQEAICVRSETYQPWLRWTVSLASGLPAPYFIVVVEDVTKRKRSEAAEREQRLLAEALQDTAVGLNSTLDLSEVLERILANVGHVVPHDAADIMLIEGGNARMVRNRGYDRFGVGDIITEYQFGIEGTYSFKQMSETGEPLIISDTLELGDQWVRTPANAWIRSHLSVPICRKDEMIGFLNLNSALPNFFTSTHADRLRVFAGQAAIAIENARLYEQAQQVGVLQERQRLAHDLHDAVSQILFSASVIAETLPRIWDINRERALELVHQLVKLNRGALAEMRTLLLELRPSQLSNTRLSDALRQLAEAINARAQLEIDFVAEGSELVPPDVQVAYYRIAQEAINNIIKHAHATQIRLYIASEKDRVELRVADDGTGFDTKADTAGFGMHSMRERAEAIGASFEVSSQVGKGTQVSVRLHLD